MGFKGLVCAYGGVIMLAWAFKGHYKQDFLLHGRVCQQVTLSWMGFKGLLCWCLGRCDYG